ncbi:hypothetical protein, partial [Klebsiella pneumoniae]|uniref:hypothetical protein n=1 Tax=Klebsiella pneumoniae TaxID=573 RepID=UPI0025A30865
EIKGQDPVLDWIRNLKAEFVGDDPVLEWIRGLEPAVQDALSNLNVFSNLADIQGWKENATAAAQETAQEYAG